MLERCAIRYQGVGRSLWFRGTAVPTRVADLVATLPQWHQGDAWSGVGLAAAYAGGVSPEGLATLRARCGAHAGDLGQGVAFAAAAWQRSGWTPPELATTVHALTGTDPRTAADWTREAEAGLRTPATGPVEYQPWRQRIRAACCSRRSDPPATIRGEPVPSAVRRTLVPALALLLCVVAGLFTRLPSVSASDADA
ncbi:DUF1702 family protein [Micromonospora sp. BRA006-A]|nr:DUF1702 family protein [Micromonospora sp. BRA006-A]